MSDRRDRDGYQHEPTIPTWRTTLQTFERLWHISAIERYAVALGYPFFLWNQRVYATRTMRQTAYTTADLDREPKHERQG